MDDAEPRVLRIGRFEIRRRLGSGGFGEVYEAFDRDRNDVLALKVLRRTDAAALYRFKQEFRALADLAHRNLVTLHELISEGDEWLLTMELIRGVSFVDYVRPVSFDVGNSGTPEPSAESSATTAWTPEPIPIGPGFAATDIWPRPLPLETLRVDRLRASLRELAEGVHALHQNAILHLDIKPSNVLVGEDGRVVLVDFGLAEQVGPRDQRPDQRSQLIGTPEYMSPEQAAGQTVSEASDWYSVGALLFRALTGLPVFTGTSSQVLFQKLDREATPPGDLLSGVPADLDLLCRDLLRRDPRLRPEGPELLVRLGVRPEEMALAGPPAAARRASVFVGRSAHLAALGAAFEQMKSGRSAVVHVIGKSGMGKTALVRRFLDGLRQVERDAIVLEGRCYEREAVPFKAVDAILDGLGHHLRRLSDARIAALLPRGADVLARVFPALRAVKAIALAQARTPGVVDPTELRRRAFAALRELFARVAERHPLVLVIDDLQWGDVDSATLLDELVRPPDQPAMLLVACYRADETESSACLRFLLSAEESRDLPSRAQRVEVAELDSEEARALALSRLSGSVDQALADAIAHEAQGSPFFIDQLAAHANEQGPAHQTLESVLRDRVARLPDPLRGLLEIIAVAGSPVEIAVAAQAAEVRSGKYDLLASLRAARLVRSRARYGTTQVEPYHDRIREAVVAHLAPDTIRRHHLQLALALEASGTTDLEALTQHFRVGGDRAKAAQYAVEAAQRSVEALAFDGAARLYSLAIELQPDGRDVAELRAKLGDALAMTGRVIESADAYLAAGSESDAGRRIELQRLAGEQYLLGFRLDEGLALLRTVLAELGMKLPATVAGAFLATVVRQLHLRLRGSGFRERREADVPPIDLQRLDMCYAVCRALGFTDSVRAIELQTRHLLLALNVGEPFRLARALAQSATADGVRARSRPRAERRLAMAKQLAERAPSPLASGLVHAATGFVHVGAGRWRDAVGQFDEAVTIYRERCVTPPHTTVLCQIYRLEALFLAGALSEYFGVIPRYFAEWQGRGNVHAEARMRMSNSHLKCFAHDDPAAAWDELRRAELSWGNRKLQLARVSLLFRQVELALYAGEFTRAWDLVTSRWPLVAPFRMFGFQTTFTLALERRAYCALGMAAFSASKPSAAASFLKSAERDARAIERWQAPWGAPIAQVVRAGVAVHRRESKLAISRLETAERGFRESGMALHLAVIRWRRGSVMGGDAGRALVQDAERWMDSQGVRNPGRMSGIIAPGLWTGA